LLWLALLGSLFLRFATHDGKHLFRADRLSAVASHSDVARHPRQVRPDFARATAARQTAHTGGARPEQTAAGASTAGQMIAEGKQLANR